MDTVYEAFFGPLAVIGIILICLAVLARRRDQLIHFFVRLMGWLCLGFAVLLYWQRVTKASFVWIAFFGLAMIASGICYYAENRPPHLYKDRDRSGVWERWRESVGQWIRDFRIMGFKRF